MPVGSTRTGCPASHGRAEVDVAKVWLKGGGVHARELERAVDDREHELGGLLNTLDELGLLLA
jgi:hypothetical protein